MKTEYEKPQIQFTSFELSENISAGCELISNSAQHMCAVPIPEWGDILYTDETAGCTMTAPNEDDGLCYHAPTDNYNVYSS